MKAGDRVIWVRSPGRSFLTGWKVERIPGVVARVCRRKVKIWVRTAGWDRIVVVSPENVVCEDDL